MSQPKVKDVLLNPIVANNPIGLQILGICSALAVTSNLKTALVMSIALTLVTGFSNLFISMIRSQNPPLLSFFDGIGNGLGYSAMLIVLGIVRELFGAGKLLGYTILPVVNDGGWYLPNGLLLLPPSAFFLIGLIIWGIRSWKKEQVEKPAFKMAPQVSSKEAY